MEIFIYFKVKNYIDFNKISFLTQPL